MPKQAFFGTIVVGTALCLSIATLALADDKHHRQWKEHRRGQHQHRQPHHSHQHRPHHQQHQLHIHHRQHHVTSIGHTGVCMLASSWVPRGAILSIHMVQLHVDGKAYTKAVDVIASSSATITARLM
jgi:hypothetical protein